MASFSNCWVLRCQNFSLDWCKQPDVGLPKPDLVVFLQLRLAEAATRGEFGRERYENGNFQERALRRFHQLRADETLNWKVRVSSGVAARKHLSPAAEPRHLAGLGLLQGFCAQQTPVLCGLCTTREFGAWRVSRGEFTRWQLPECSPV